MDSALKAISDPVRRKILMLVHKQEMSAGDIATHFDISRPGVSQHLTVLKAAKLLQERRAGTTRLYSIDSREMMEIKAFLEQFWTNKLKALKAAVESDYERKKK